MDSDAIELMTKVWSHAGVAGHVWVPHIAKIDKPGEKFFEGKVLKARKPELPDLRDEADWYWTPAVSSSDSRKAKEYPAQRAIWVDCDDSYNDALLESLKPSFMWETSPGHKQAVWLLREPVARAEFHRDGFIGMLTQALGADKSGVDVGQLLRVPGTWHHKRKPFKGRILRNAGTVYTRGQILTRVARGLGFPPGLASELGADDPYGDRSKVLWKFARNAAELGLPQDLVFKLIKATKWNKWADEPERLKEDIARAYDQQPTATPTPDPEPPKVVEEEDSDGPTDPWKMATVDTFGPISRRPVSWVLPGIIPEAGVGLIVAAPKVGKTRIAIEIALGLATGRKPLGISVQRQQAVGFFSLEDGEHLFADRLSEGMRDGRDRFHWDGHIRPDLTWEPPRPMSLFTRFDAMDLTKPEDKERLLDVVQEYGLRLAIIDTLSMAIGDHNVSDQKEMNGILKDVRKIARATKCAIAFIHHTRKRVFEKGETVQESILGATALHAWSEFTLSLAAPSEDNDFLRLGVQTKMGNHLHYINSQLRIIKKPPVEPAEE